MFNRIDPRTPEGCQLVIIQEASKATLKVLKTTVGVSQQQ